MINQIKRDRIYKHTHLNQKTADSFKPLFESAFAEELGRYNDTPRRKKIGEEKLRFATEQYANRVRVSNMMGVSPLNEDANIFGVLGKNVTKLFESVPSAPSNIIGMGNVTNPMEGNAIQGGMWNPAYKPGTGDIPSYVFGLQSQLALHCIGFDLLPTIAVDTPKVVINYVDTVYGGGSFDDVTSLPSYIDIEDKLFTYAWVKNNNLLRATSTLTLVAGDGKAMKVRYMIRSTIKPALTIEVLSTGDYASDIYTETNKYSVKDVVTAINAANGAKVYVNDETTGANLSQAFTVNYTSAIRTNIAEAASNDNSRTGMTRGQMEKGPKHKLNVISMDKQLEMVGIEIEADTTNIQIKDMAAMGINVIAHLYTGVQNQLVQTLDEIILDHLYRMGVQHAVNAWESQGIDMSLFIAAPATTDIPYKDVVSEDQWRDMLNVDVRSRMGNIKNSIQSSSYENQITHADRLYARILRVAEFVAYDNRLGATDFIVLSGDLAACLKKNSKFVVCPHVETLSSSPELVYTGTLYDIISVYKNPKTAFNDPRILMGRRGDDTDPGSKLLAYDLAASRQAIVEGTMAEKIRVWSRFAIADVGFYPELSYMTFVAVNKYDWC